MVSHLHLHSYMSIWDHKSGLQKLRRSLSLQSPWVDAGMKVRAWSTTARSLGRGWLMLWESKHPITPGYITGLITHDASQCMRRLLSYPRKRSLDTLALAFLESKLLLSPSNGFIFCCYCRLFGVLHPIGNTVSLVWKCESCQLCVFHFGMTPANIGMLYVCVCVIMKPVVPHVASLLWGCSLDYWKPNTPHTV